MKLDPKMQEKAHRRFGEIVWEILNGKACDHCGRTSPTAKDLTVIRQWLADNGTTADLRSQTPLHHLADGLPEFDDGERITKPGKTA